MIRFALIVIGIPCLVLAKDACEVMGLGIFAQTQSQGRGIFLGEVSQDAADPVSITNESGKYGSKLSSTCIFNTTGFYGSSTSSYSPSNPIGERPPVVWRYLDSADQWTLAGYITLNTGFPDSLRINPDTLLAKLRGKNCVDAPKVQVLPDIRFDSISITGIGSIQIGAFVWNHSNTEVSTAIKYSLYLNDTLFRSDELKALPRWERVGFSHGFQAKSDTLRIRLVLDEANALKETNEGNNVHEALWVRNVGLSILSRPSKAARIPTRFHTIDGKVRVKGKVPGKVYPWNP